MGSGESLRVRYLILKVDLDRYLVLKVDLERKLAWANSFYDFKFEKSQNIPRNNIQVRSEDRMIFSHAR